LQGCGNACQQAQDEETLKQIHWIDLGILGLRIGGISGPGELGPKQEAPSGPDFMQGKLQAGVPSIGGRC
jgi:hypothetical protein